MPAVTSTEFRAKFPEFTTAAYTTATVNARIAEARAIHDIRKTAVLYLTAHLLALDAEATGALDGGSGVVVSEQIGPRRVSYLTQSKGGEAIRVFCETTSYGRLFNALVASSPRGSIGARVV